MEALRAQALRARDAGEHERAIGLWRAMLTQHPDDWRLGLELKRDLKAALHYPESDKQFRRAARSLPDAEWLAHYSALYAYHGEDLETLDARVRGMLERLPGDHRLWAILGDVASQRRDWTGSLAAFTAAFEAEPREDYRLKRETAAMYLRLTEPSPPGRRPGEGVSARTRLTSSADCLPPALSRGRGSSGRMVVRSLSSISIAIRSVRRSCGGSSPMGRR